MGLDGTRRESAGEMALSPLGPRLLQVWRGRYATCLSPSRLKQQPQLPSPLTFASESRLAGSAGTTTSTVRVSTAITPTGMPPSLQGGAQVSWGLAAAPKQIRGQWGPPRPIARVFRKWTAMARWRRSGTVLLSLAGYFYFIYLLLIFTQGYVY